MSELVKKEDLHAMKLDGLFETERARNMFLMLSEELIDAGVLANPDVFPLMDMVNTFDDIIKLREMVRLEPMVEDRNDTKYGTKEVKRSNPLWRTLRDQQRTFLMYAKDFGTTPGARNIVINAFNKGRIEENINPDKNVSDKTLTIDVDVL